MLELFYGADINLIFDIFVRVEHLFLYLARCFKQNTFFFV